MSLLKLLPILLLLVACAKKSTQELLLGEWQITSWETQNGFNQNKDLDTLKSENNLLFHKDSLCLTMNNEKKTYHYLLKGDTIFVNEDHLGFYQIKLLDNTNLHLYKAINLTYASEDSVDVQMHSETVIELKRK